jgi:hypothetical protein
VSLSRLRHDGRAGEGRKKRGFRALLKKRRGTNASLYLAELRTGRLASSDAIPDTAGGEGGHGAATPDGVIHRYFNNMMPLITLFLLYPTTKQLLC